MLCILFLFLYLFFSYFSRCVIDQIWIRLIIHCHYSIRSRSLSLILFLLKNDRNLWNLLIQIPLVNLSVKCFSVFSRLLPYLFEWGWSMPLLNEITGLSELYRGKWDYQLLLIWDYLFNLAHMDSFDVFSYAASQISSMSLGLSCLCFFLFSYLLLF